jgi:molybdenum cofactor cytidylyltransferase
MDQKLGVGAVILAAGLSRRMGRPKLTLAWGDNTVIGSVIQSLLEGGISPIIVVTGGARQEVEAAVSEFPVETIFNPAYEQGEMLSSVQAGLRALNQKAEAALIVLGDQPQIQAETVSALISIYDEYKTPLLIPSYQRRRGHPWLVGSVFWEEILALNPPDTLRDFLNQNAGMITYMTVDNDSVLQDLDTPEDYGYYKPRGL